MHAKLAGKYFEGVHLNLQGIHWADIYENLWKYSFKKVLMKVRRC